MTTRAEINERLKKVNIKGKPYVEVAQRVQGFWEIFPNGKITTDWLRLEDEQCVCQASVWDGDKLLAQGTAWEQRKGNINTTSYVENCETSAIGRALGNAGIGSVQSIASADEMAHAMSQQVKNPNHEFAPKIVEVDKNDRTYWRGLYIKACKLYPAEEVKATVDSIIDAADSKAENWTDEQCQLVASALQFMIDEKENSNDD